MNDAVRNDLANHISRIIGTLPAFAVRKQQVREELLAHLLDIYDEELERLSDAPAAANRAKQRFGRPDDLRSELAAAVPWGERLLVGIFGKGNTMWRWLWIVGVIGILVGLGFVFPAIAHLSRADHVVRNEAYPLAAQVALLTLGLILSLVGLGTVGYSAIRAFRARGC